MTFQNASCFFRAVPFLQWRFFLSMPTMFRSPQAFFCSDGITATLRLVSPPFPSLHMPSLSLGRPFPNKQTAVT